MKKIKVLAVGDPAVYVYTDKKHRFLDIFEQETGIQVIFDIIKWSDYYATLLESFKLYQYDIVMVAGHLWLKEFVDQGFLKKFNGDFQDTYCYDDILPSIRQELEIKNDIYLLPSFCDGHILLYRKSQLKSPLNEMLTIDQLIQAVKENTDEHKNTFVLKAHPSEIFLDFLPYLRSEGIDAFDEKGMPLFNNNKGVTALRKYIEMRKYCDSQVHTFGNEEVLKALQENRCKLGVSWGGQLGQIMNESCLEPDDIQFSALETSWNVTWSFGINHLCRDKESAEQFLEFITSKEVDKAVGAYCGNPTRLSSFLNEETSHRWYPVLLKMINNAKSLPSLPNTGQMIGVLTDAITKTFNNEDDAEDALNEAYQRIMQ